MQRSGSASRNVEKADRIKVAVRCRPLLGTEDKRICVNIKGNICSVSNGFRLDESEFGYDFCFPWETSQDDIFQALGLHVLRNALDGYHATLFAYGQTGAGKSYSVHGTRENPGILPRMCDALFDEIDRSPDNLKHIVKASYLEIYNERLRDLLTTEEPRKLEISSNPASGSAQIIGLSVFEVSNADDVRKMMQFGNDFRVKATTSMNSVSSRSHTIFTLECLQTNIETGDTQRSKIQMVDLAGSERQTKAQVVGDRLREGCVINQSLSYLGLVITGLAKGDSFVPFRNSKLTHFLIEGLSGNSKTAMIAAISPSRSNYDETISTLRFATTCKLVKTRAVVNINLEHTMAQEVDALKRQLESAKEALRGPSLSGPMLVQPHFVFPLKEKVWVGSAADNDLVLPHCQPSVCSIELSANVARCKAESQFHRNGIVVAAQSMFTFEDDDLVEFGPGATFRFQCDFGFSTRRGVSEDVKNALSNISPAISVQECTRACEVFNAMHYTNDISEALPSLPLLYDLGREGSEIVVVQSLFSNKRPVVAVKEGFGLWTGQEFSELRNEDDVLIKAFRSGDLDAACAILQNVDKTRALSTEHEEQMETYRKRVCALESLREEDSRTIDKLSNEFIELSRESAGERGVWTKTQEELVKTSDEYAEECKQARTRILELEERVREQEAAMRSSRSLIEELRMKNVDASRENEKNVYANRHNGKNVDANRENGKNVDANRENGKNVDVNRENGKNVDSNRENGNNANTNRENEKNTYCNRENGKHADDNRENWKNTYCNRENGKDADANRESVRPVDSAGESESDPARNASHQKFSGAKLSPKLAWSPSRRDVAESETHPSSSSTSKVSETAPVAEFGPRAITKTDALGQDLASLSDTDPGFVEALAGLMIQQIAEGSAQGLLRIVERLDSVAQARSTAQVDSLDALLPLMTKGLRKFSQSGSFVRASFHCLARLCVRSSHNKWWLVEQAVRGDFVELFRGAMNNKNSSVLGQACKFLSVVVLDATADGNLGRTATPYASDDFLDLVMTIMQKHSYGSGTTSAHTFGYACHAISAFLHAKENPYLRGPPWIVFKNRQGVENVLQGLRRYVRNRIAVFAVVQLLNAICISGEDLCACIREPDDFLDSILHAMRVHASHKGVQRISIHLLYFCLQSSRFDVSMLRSSPNLQSALQNCHKRLAEENGQFSQGQRLLEFLCEQLKE